MATATEQPTCALAKADKEFKDELFVALDKYVGIMCKFMVGAAEKCLEEKGRDFNGPFTLSYRLGDIFLAHAYEYQISEEVLATTQAMWNIGEVSFNIHPLTGEIHGLFNTNWG